LLLIGHLKMFMYQIMYRTFSFLKILLKKSKSDQLKNNKYSFFRFDNYTSTVVVDNITVSLGLWDTVRIWILFSNKKKPYQ